MGERGAGGWAAGFWTGDQYIQVDLGSMMAITMVATQGRRTHNQWVTKYSLSYSLDGNQWEHYKEGCVKIFNGNHDQNTVVTNELNRVVNTRHIRLNVKRFRRWPSLRMELYGC
ncbi:discoidin-2 [Exaiptasia diaphana]|uniref:F5/8 type C domain-containing protein n=1 Tax=Exaiptasia diaphana TaxID=2652724 RepID=A0A913XP79_EXADI|nr:discoidin-2 [Exaiptasia diaphana]